MINKIDWTFENLESSKKGLTNKEAKKRLEQYGYNILKKKKESLSLKIFLNQFKNFILYVLFGAAIISIFIGEILNFWIILATIFFVIILGFIQEYKAEKTMESLKNIITPTAKVLRDGELIEIITENLVPGDILILEAGDKITADAVIYEAISLKIDESAITGESIPIEKNNGEPIYTGTQVVYGKCKAIVTKTGMKTKLGKIAELIQDVKEDTPLQLKIDLLAKKLAIIAFILCILTFILGTMRGGPIGEMLIVALALMVAAVPEGLPLTLTLTLAFSMDRMGKHNAVVKKMIGVETLGSVTTICTDKTGTLTKNEMTVEKIYVNNKLYEVSGSGFDLNGQILFNNKPIDILKETTLSHLLTASVLCNNANVKFSSKKPKIIGDPTEAALVIAAIKANLWKDNVDNIFTRVEEIVFTSERKIMTTIHKKNENLIVYSKGAPEIILEKCKYFKENDKIKKLTLKDKQRILKKNIELGNEAYRVLGVASKISNKTEEFEKNLVFLGLIAMMDPPRDEVKTSIEQCKNAGIKVIMITGDNENTAKAIAKKIGMKFNKNLSEIEETSSEKILKIIKDGVITGKELEELNNKEFERIVDYIYIYARILPEQKLRIVEALKEIGHIVAMTGDGVNDAPALKKAHIGIAMGIKGTEVAKEASEIVLQDDNFATIVEAIKQGRGIYENIEKFICYLISRNFTELILILLGIIFFGFEYLPLIAIQILFINTFDESMPAIGLGLDTPRDNIMYKPPRPPNERFMNKKNSLLIFSMALFMALTAFFVFYIHDPINNIQHARTMVFITITSMIFCVPFAFKSLEEPIYKIDIFKNKYLLLGVFVVFLITLIMVYHPFFNKIFQFTTPSLYNWIIPISVAFTVLIFAEIIKKISKTIFENKIYDNQLFF